ncbi:ParB/RepB/Spo0J family partition protein [Streptomyces lavenduligriseus]|uniref:ParB/RepB/Spo0J family partition protein n=1 Tax=Streptomyces lavenduligriseus TaxID=67315 RepID=A0ABT0P320_9ACTN|nr:ParB/RepB/Spo0J family partition protein [Streptomyces lavenduligriseus]MCL3998147.1 ParB/RepB/Spo0J family partition protein [Streptomyces lavenduligriseus]
MSKADQLGAGRFGGGVRPVSARRQAVAAATGVPTDAVPPPTELAPHRISLNPDNPRSSLGDLTDLAGSLKTHGQKQAITVMNRDAYIKANPEREADLEPDTTHVVIDGSSRLAAAREAQLPTVKVMVSDDQGTNSEELLESALVANIHRQDLGELDEARALQRLLAIHGSQTALAKRLHRSQGWVSQRLALLKLTPELQAKIGDEPIDLLRAVANKPPAQQQEALDELKAARAREEEEKRSHAKARRSDAHPVTHRDGARSAKEPSGPAVPIPAEPAGNSAPSQPDNYYGVIGDNDADAPSPAAPSAVATDGASQHQPLPEQRVDASPSADSQERAEHRSQPRRVPYDEPGTLAMLLDRNIDNDDTFFDLLRILGTKGLQRDPIRLGELARSFAEQAAVQAD